MVLGEQPQEMAGSRGGRGHSQPWLGCWQQSRAQKIRQEPFFSLPRAGRGTTGATLLAVPCSRLQSRGRGPCPGACSGCHMRCPQLGQCLLSDGSGRGRQLQVEGEGGEMQEESSAAHHLFSGALRGRAVALVALGSAPAARARMQMLLWEDVAVPAVLCLGMASSEQHRTKP